MDIDLPNAHYDVAISLEVLSHVADQQAFINKIAALLTPEGILMLATQNRPALERSSIPAPKPGQLRRWVDRSELEQLLKANFCVQELFSITPQFNRGVLRLVNARRVKQLAANLGLSRVMGRIKKIQEGAGLGWTLMALAQRRKR
jgi:SAM-dependent methyltransferase